MKTLVVLKGKADSGKTATIRRVHAMLLERYPGSEVERLPRKREIHAVLVIRGVRVGIASQGDAPSQLEKCFAAFADCDMVVCATRSFRLYSDPIKDLEMAGCKVVYIDKNREESASKYAEATAQAAANVVAVIEREIEALANARSLEPVAS